MKRIAAYLSLLLAVSLLLVSCGFPGESPDGSGGEDSLTVYFIDVGQGDSELLVCGGEAMLIDGGGASKSDLIYSFLKNHGIDHLDYIVATHAHEDHVGGLSGALNYASTGIALSPVTEYESRAFESFVSYLDKQGVVITVPAPGDVFNLGGAEITVLAPLYEYSDTNNTSIVLRAVYGETSFLLTGDAERESELDLVESGAELRCTVLKVGHHGSNTSSSYPFLYAAEPLYAVISCGAGNSYGHPHEGTLSRLRDADVTLFRTDLQGTITCVSDGKTVTFTTERNSAAITNPTQGQSGEGSGYIGNIVSRKFHKPDCTGLPAEKNRVYISSRAEAIDEGYEPCGICKP